MRAWKRIRFFKPAKKEAENKKTLMLEEAGQQVALTVENGKKILEAEKTKMVEEAKKEIVSLAMAATEKLLKNKQDLSSL